MANNMNRTYIKDLASEVGKEVSISGWVDVRRDQGKMVFMDIRDVSGKVQAVVLPNHAEALEQVKEVRTEWVLTVKGIVNKRPERNIKAEVLNGDIELEITNIEVLSKAQELPFALDAELNFDTYLDYLPLTLRTQRARDIFTMQASIVQAYRNSLVEQGFTEFEAPALVGGDAEGGAAAFKVDYYYDQTAYLATSPQFYKQIMVGPFERAFTIAKIFRAEKHATTRHLSEAVCMDFEMGFIQNELDVMRVLENTIKQTVKIVTEKHADMFERFKTTPPLVPNEIPILTLKEVHDLLGVEHVDDMEPEHERNICEWAKKEKGSDFVFITRYPTKKRAFYTYEDKSEAPYSRGFDLLFRGLEINSGAQRIHNYDDLVAKMESRGLDPKKFSYYLQAFKYGLPPHGGCSTGLERMTARMLEIANVKEATAFPRDLNRIDNRLSE
jgi:nondiscriminating aspartyl-tRNA synthetase